MRKVVAVLALTPLLICSGTGLCWTELAPKAKGHDCCKKPAGESLAGARSCATPVKEAAAPVLAPPPPVVVHAIQARPVPAIEIAAAFDPAFPVFRPPQVLRI
jgi:hypothetical protein